MPMPRPGSHPRSGRGDIPWSQAWNHELAKGYTGWDEDLVTKVARMYHEARRLRLGASLCLAPRAGDGPAA
jgi:hypothetical protein